MVRTDTEQVDRKCILCNTAATHGPRCHAHHKAWKAEAARRRRNIVREREMLENPRLRRAGWQRCGQCRRKKRLCEFSTSLPGRRGKLNKICDTCLTRIYNNPARRSADTELSPGFWRKRAYTANTVGRQRRARDLGVKLQHVTLRDLAHIVKPQELAGIYAQQNHRCCYCSCALTHTNITVDHAVSLSNGGEHVLHNLRLCCIDCNHLKHTRNEADFLVFVREYTQRFNVSEASDKEPGR